MWRIRFDLLHRMIAQGTSKLRQLLVTLFYHQQRGHPRFSVSLFPVLPLTAATFLYHLTKLASEAQEQPSVRPVVCSKSVGCVAWLRGQQLILFGNRCAPCSQQKHLFSLCCVEHCVLVISVCVDYKQLSVIVLLWKWGYNRIVHFKYKRKKTEDKFSCCWYVSFVRRGIITKHSRGQVSSIPSSVGQAEQSLTICLSGTLKFKCWEFTVVYKPSVK